MSEQEKRPTGPDEFRHLETTVRSMIDTENRITSERFGWLTAIQTILIGALAVLWGKTDAARVILWICVVGLVVSVMLVVALCSGSMAQGRLLKYWDSRRGGGYAGPDVIGQRPLLPWFTWLGPTNIIGLVFVVAWIGILYARR